MTCPEVRGLHELAASQVAGHDDDRVGEVHQPSLSVGQPSVVQDLEQDVEHIRMGLLDLIEQHDRIRTPPDDLGQLSALVVTDISRGCSDQTRYAELLHVLRHVYAGQGLLVIEQHACQNLCQLRLSDSGRACEQERSERPVVVADTGLVAPDGVGDRGDGLVLTDHPLGERLLEVQVLLHLGTLHLGHGHSGPGGDDPCDIVLIDFLAQELVVALHRLEPGAVLLDLLLELRDLTVHDLGGLGEITVAFGDALLRPQFLEARLLLADTLDRVPLVLPPQVHGVPGVLQVRELGVDLLQPVPGGRIILLGKGLLLDLQLHELALYLVQFLRLALDLDLELAGGLVYQVYGLVGQEPVGDVPVGKDRGGDQSIVLYTYAVVDLVAVLDATEDGNGVLNRRFRCENGLEPSFQGLVLLDVLAVLVQRRGSDGMQFTACQGRLDEVGGIGRAFRRTCSDDGVQLVYEEDYPAFAPGYLVDHSLQTFLELAAELGACNQCTDIERQQALVLQRIGDIAAHDPLCKAFDDCCLSDSRLTDEHRVVLRLP